MASYYYLISSLPMLRADQEMPFSYGTFLEMCRSAVGSSTYKLLENLSAASREGPLLKEWSGFYGALAEEMAYQRNVRLGKAAEAPAIRDEETVRTVGQALNAKNPLEAELMLLGLEFDRLDALVSMHYFDDYVLFGYALKLKLLERLTVFDKDSGKAEFKRLLDNTQKQILSIG